MFKKISLILTSVVFVLSCSKFLTDYNSIADAQNNVAAPVFSVDSGSYTSIQSVTLTSTTSGALIFYTIDGSTPTHDNGTPSGTTTIFSSAIDVAVNISISALAYKASVTDSSVATASYRINIDTVATPVISLAAGLYSGTRLVTLSSTSSEVTLLYTTDGSTPTHNNGIPTGTTNTFTTALSLTTSQTIKVMAYRTGLNDSSVTTVGYTFCPANYIAVPANSTVGTTNDFCVAKYEMKCAADATGLACSGAPLSQAANQPWVNITLNNSKIPCPTLGSNYHLTTNPEWMTIARNIESTDVNWSTGTVNSGSLNQGHNDNSPSNSLVASTDNDACSGTGQTCSITTWNSQRRTHVLSNGNVIWDIAGNVDESVDKTSIFTRATPAGGQGNVWREINTAVAGATMPDTAFKSKNTALTSANGIGLYLSGNDGSGGAYARGGSWGGFGGIYNIRLDYSPVTNIFDDFGFRCAYTP